jgi:ABC-type multidrug transport system fused ATPase/permease subunit
MKSKERIHFYFFLFSRATVSLLDLAGILAIGFLATSMALFLTEGSDPDRKIQVGSISFPAITAQSLPIIAGLIMLLFIAKAVISIALSHQLAHFLAKIEARAARVIAKNAFGQGLERSRLNSREEILFSVQAGSPSAFNGLLNSLGTLVAEGSLFLLVIVSFTVVNPLLALISIGYFGLIGLVIQLFIGKLMQRTGSEIAKTTVQANAGLSDLGDVLREVVILGREDYFYDRIYQSRMKASGTAATQFVLGGMPRYIVETALIIAIAALLFFQSLSGDFASSAATLGIFLTGGLRLTASLLPLQSALLVMKKSGPAAVTALDLLEDFGNNIAVKSPNQDTGLEQPPVSVDVEKLSFTFNKTLSPILSEISLRISPGSQAAIIGSSGSGKSTLADLILGLLEPTSGSVLVNDMNPRELIKSQPGLLAYVPQRPGMIFGTIAQNIALGLEVNEIDEHKLNKAISEANLTDYIDSLPNGVHTDIGKRKDELSGGQLQRIGLARALYTEPKLLIMDEATSALDAESENEINKALDRMRKKVTVLLIAHRLNTIQRSDIVFFLERGSIEAAGTFAELLKSNETVRNLAKLMNVKSN